MSHEDIVLSFISTWKKLSQILHESLLIRIILSNVYYTFYLYLHFVFQFASDWLLRNIVWKFFSVVEYNLRT